jgi:hypothetical protein
MVAAERAATDVARGRSRVPPSRTVRKLLNQQWLEHALTFRLKAEATRYRWGCSGRLTPELQTVREDCGFQKTGRQPALEK